MTEALPIEGDLVVPASDLDVDYARASGPGGQHVNVTETRVRLRFALGRCAALTDSVKHRLRAAHPAWLTSEDEIVITSDKSRSRKQNEEDCRERLAAAIREALVPPKPRRPTRPSRASKQRRLEDKKRRAGIKRTRGRPDDV